MKRRNQKTTPHTCAGAAPKCRDLRAQPLRCKGLEGRSPPGATSAEGAAPWNAESAGQRPACIREVQGPAPSGYLK